MKEAEAEITLTSTTESAEDLARAFPEGSDVEIRQDGREIQPPPTEKPQQDGEPGKPRITRDWRDGNIPVGVQKRLDKLTARLREAEEELARSRSARPAPVDQRVSPPSPRNGESRSATDEARIQEARIQEGRSRYKDWDEAFERARANNVQIPEIAIEAARQMPNNPDVAYYLAKHPEVCGELLNIPPEAAVTRIQQISQNLQVQAILAQQPGNQEWQSNTFGALKAEQDSAKLAEAARNIRIPAALAPAVHAALISQANGHAVFIHLLRHPELIQDLRSLNPHQAYAKVVRIAADLDRPEPKIQSKAPPPSTPVRGSTAAPTRLDDPNMDIDTWVRKRNQQERERRRR